MVDVNTQNKTISVNVSSSGVSSNVNASGDTTLYYSNKAREWAISNRIVDGVDYSSKYYAGRANQSALNAQSFAQSAQESYNNFQQSVDGALSNIDSSVQGAIDEINNTKTDIITDIEFVADGEKQEIQELADNAKDDIKSTGFYMEDDKLYFINSKGEIEEFKSGGGGLEIGDIGFTQMAIDESKGKRRILNGQLIIQEQYVQFANIIKNSVALNPDLACTEEEWQTAVTMSEAGICDKYVIDDEAGTIRLPKYPSYFIGGINDIAPVAGNGKTLGLTDGDKNIGIGSANNYLIGGTNYYDKNYGYNNSSIGSYGTNWEVYGVTTDPTKSGIEAQIKQEQIKGTYFIQVATGAETEDNIINEIELNNPFSLLDYKYTEAPLYNVSWLLANGTYNGSNAIHPSAYQALVVENNAEIEVGSTVTLPIGTEYTKRGLSVKLSTDSDITDYDFRINTAEETFMLPTKVKLASGKAVVGNGIALGMTNGTQTAAMNAATVNNYWGVLRTSAPDTAGTPIGTKIPTTTSMFENETAVGITTDPTISGIETSDSGLYLYFYVGETVQNANLINAGRIEEKISNLIPDNSSLISSYSVPSGRYIDLTVGANESTYTAPADGWFFAQNNVTGTAGLTLINETKGYNMGNCVERAWAIPVLLPCQKGDLVRLSCWNQFNVVTFRFYYLEGDQ